MVCPGRYVREWGHDWITLWPLANTIQMRQRPTLLFWELLGKPLQLNGWSSRMRIEYVGSLPFYLQTLSKHAHILYIKSQIHRYVLHTDRLPIHIENSNIIG